MLERCRRSRVAMRTLESTDNLMPFPCDLWLDKRQKRLKLKGLLPSFSFHSNIQEGTESLATEKIL